MATINGQLTGSLIDGDYEVEIVEASRRDEIGDMAKGLNEFQVNRINM